LGQAFFQPGFPVLQFSGLYLQLLFRRVGIDQVFFLRRQHSRYVYFLRNMSAVSKTGSTRINRGRAFNGDKPVSDLVRAGSQGLCLFLSFDTGVVFVLFIRAQQKEDRSVVTLYRFKRAVFIDHILCLFPDHIKRAVYPLEALSGHGKARKDVFFSRHYIILCRPAFICKKAFHAAAVFLASSSADKIADVGFQRINTGVFGNAKPAYTRGHLIRGAFYFRWD